MPTYFKVAHKAMQSTQLVGSSELPNGVKPLLLLYMETTCNWSHLGQYLDEHGYQKREL